MAEALFEHANNRQTCYDFNRPGLVQSAYAEL